MKIYDITNIPQEFYSIIEFEELESVKNIIADVKANGDNAVRKYTSEFDKIDLDNFKVNDDEINFALNSLNDELKKAIEFSINNVREFAKHQLASIKNLDVNINNSQLGHRIIPLEIVGAYIPGGNYPLLSTAIMTIVPAKVAGVKKVIACSPKISNEVIAAAHLAGADEIYKIGGVQAVAAMAYSTETICAVDKIVGPGNKFVTAAKKQVFGKCGIDFLAGPSEVMIVADETCNIDYVAADILAQCEHDKDARAYLICNKSEIAEKIIQKAEEFLETLPTKNVAKFAFEQSIALVCDNFEDAITLTNKRAPEHLELCFKDCEKYQDKFTNYGSLFLNSYSAEVFGDYVSGTNHTLPTNMVARYSGGLSVFDFIKIQTYQNISNKDVKIISKNASILAKYEGLLAHKLASDVRKISE